MELDKVIKGMEEVIAEAIYPGRPRMFMMPLELAEDALALLKAQEPVVMAGAELTDAELIEKIRKAPIVLKPNVDVVPVARVMTLEEAKSASGYVIVQSRSCNILELQLIKDGFVYDSTTVLIDVDDLWWEGYNRHWRLWTSIPTDAKMEATPWNT